MWIGDFSCTACWNIRQNVGCDMIFVIYDLKFTLSFQELCHVNLHSLLAYDCY